MVARRFTLPLLLAVAFLTKLAALLALGDHPLLQPDSGLDTGAYVGLAARVASGDLLLGKEPYFVSPLYIYFLAPILKLTGGSLFTVRFVQILFGTWAVGLVYATGRRLFGESAAIAGAAIYLLTGVVTFYEVLILQAALDPFLTALALFLLARALTSEEEGSSKVKWAFAWAGLSFGLLALNRPNVAPCALAVVVLLPFGERSFRGWPKAAAFLLGLGLAIAPVTLRNLTVSREFVLISSHGGLNFYIGNNPEADGTYHLVPGITPSIAGQAADAKKVTEAEAGRPLSTRAVSAHFARKAWRWIAAEPAAAAKLFARKLWYVLSGDEIPLNFSYPWYREKSLALKLLPVGPGLLVPLGGAGLVLALLGVCRLTRRRFTIWASFVPAYALLVAAFFVATRYRLPLYVPLAVGVGAVVGAAFRTGETRRLIPAGLVAALLAIPALWPTGLWDGTADEEMHLVLWEIERGESGAMRHAEAAAPAHPDPALVWLRVGRSFEAAGRSDEAIRALSTSQEIDPDRPGTASLLSALLEKRGLKRVLAGDAAGARPDLEEAVRLDASSASARLNLAAVLAELGERDRARDLVRQALDLKPDYQKARVLLQALERRK